jgi:hypothetical protein
VQRPGARLHAAVVAGERIKFLWRIVLVNEDGCGVSLGAQGHEFADERTKVVGQDARPELLHGGGGGESIVTAYPFG